MYNSRRKTGEESIQMMCPYCKETIQDGAIKCRYCGSMLSSDPMNTISMDTVTAEELRAFVDGNSSYYLQNFSKFSITGRQKFCVTWNWSCFGFTFLWMLYRKMYLLSIVTFIVFCMPGVNIIMHIIAGVVGNYLYYDHAKHKILEVRSTHYSDKYFQVLQEIGGTNRWVITLGIVLTILMAIFFAVFFSAIVSSMRHIGEITI